MKKLVRFGIAMEEALLRAFDKEIKQKGYGNRSEAFSNASISKDLAVLESPS